MKTIKKITPLFTAVLAFALGALWYSPYLFASFWQKATGIQPGNENMMTSMIVGFLLMTIMAYGIRYMMDYLKVPSTYIGGLIFGLMISLFVCSSLGIVYVYSGKAAWITMWAIDAGYQTVFLTMMGTVLAVW